MIFSYLYHNLVHFPHPIYFSTFLTQKFYAQGSIPYCFTNIILPVFPLSSLLTPNPRVPQSPSLILFLPGSLLQPLLLSEMTPFPEDPQHELLYSLT